MPSFSSNKASFTSTQVELNNCVEPFKPKAGSRGCITSFLTSPLPCLCLTCCRRVFRLASYFFIFFPWVSYLVSHLMFSSFSFTGIVYLVLISFTCVQLTCPVHLWKFVCSLLSMSLFVALPHVCHTCSFQLFVSLCYLSLPWHPISKFYVCVSLHSLSSSTVTDWTDQSCSTYVL